MVVFRALLALCAALVAGGVLSRMRETLLCCGSFDSDAALRSFFDDERLYPWRDHIPGSARNREAWVDAPINTLLEQSTARGESVLAFLLHVLAQKIDPGDACHHDFLALAAELGESWR